MKSPIEKQQSVVNQYKEMQKAFDTVITALGELRKPIHILTPQLLIPSHRLNNENIDALIDALDHYRSEFEEEVVYPSEQVLDDLESEEGKAETNALRRDYYNSVL